MMKLKHWLIFSTAILILLGASSCGTKEKTFQIKTDQFADLYIARYQVPGFEDLPLQQKQLLYYLYKAALSGRDIYYDQNYKYNLVIRRTLEAIVKGYSGDRTTEEFEKFMVFTKRVWFSNGIHHHYSTRKLPTGFPSKYFAELLGKTPEETLPLKESQSGRDLFKFITPIIFNPNIGARKVNRDPGADHIAESATNYYQGLTLDEVRAYYDRAIDRNDPTPISYGLNSKLMKENGRIVEKVWKVGGMYTEAIEEIVYWLEKASSVAENEKQKKALNLLIKYYRTGDLETFDEYNIAWVQDVDSRVDVTSGFIEVYADPIGYRGAYESVVSIKDMEATKRIAAFSQNAQWFEDHSPIMESHKKPEVKGIVGKVITVVAESGDSSPSSPGGINLPNANWIRANHGSKSVTLGNIMAAVDEVKKDQGALEEFAYSTEEIERTKKWNLLAKNLSVDLHEVIGHASGRLEPGVRTPKETLGTYRSTLEEARATLVSLYYIMDPKLIEIGLMPDLEVGKAAYDRAVRRGFMTQLDRIELGDNIQQDHMRGRQMIPAWAYEQGKQDNVIERVIRDGKTYFVIHDYDRLRELFGELLREVQRIKSQGDYEAGMALIENYGVKVDPELHAEVLARYEKLNIAPYGGFINPRLVPVMKGGKIVDVKIEYPDDFVEQMLEYARDYSFLPTYN
jgi:dipeptidyl-peptidase-3